MAFKQDIAPFSAAEIISTLGCPQSTAYDWLTGRRSPPAWQHPHWLALLKKASQPAPKPAKRRNHRTHRA